MSLNPHGSVWSKTSQWILAAGLAACLPVSAKVLDNFNGATKTGWTDSNPASLPLPPATQAGGTFTFQFPALGQPYFTASTKTTETFELKDGRTIEFRADMVHGQGPDSFAVLAWIPTATGANTLAGYGLAKSDNQILITKGIGKYFVDEDVQVKNDNVTLVLNLYAKGGAVRVTGRVLDKEDNNRVLWESSVWDTTAADSMAGGQDNPSAPFITTGNYVLYLYGDNGTDPSGYQVIYDNAETFVMDDAVLDDFNGAAKTGWTDSNPASLPLPPATQANGNFTFAVPALGQPYFVASTKTTKTYDLSEGNMIELRADMVHGQGPDSFAVLSWIPTATGANTLAGYGLAKSDNQILITKGIGKYFVDEDVALKNENVTLVLNLSVKDGSVFIVAQVLDKDDSNRVIWQRTVLDTVGTDSMAGGADSPSAPFITTGNAVLYLYADNGTDPSGYQMVYDNLIVATAPVGNTSPIISDVSPIKGANFLAAPATLSFKALDDKPLPDAGLSVVLNGTTYTTANGLSLSGSTTSRTVTLSGLAADTVYIGTLKVVDSDGVEQTSAVWFDTLRASAVKLVEVEDFNYDNGKYFNDPVRSAEFGAGAPNSYVEVVGLEGVDYHDSRTSPNVDCMYRTSDPIRMQHSLDLNRGIYDNNAFIYDYDVGDLATGDWMNYTRNFATGSYEVYLREAVVNFSQAESVLEKVTSDPTQPNQTVTSLGSFLGTTSGFTFRDVPLTDGAGLSKVVLRLSGVTTFRLRHVTADGGGSDRYLNYLVFVPVQNAAVQRATASSVTPNNNSTLASVRPTISATLVNRDTSVNVSTVALKVNGSPLTATVTPAADGASVSAELVTLPPNGSTVNCEVTFKDNEGVDISVAWSFVISYQSLDPVNSRPGPGLVSGFKCRMVQAPTGSNLENTVTRAEDQLALSAAYQVYVDTNFDAVVINMAQDDRSSGYFGAPDFPELIVPGIDEVNGTDDFVVECKAWLQLSAGSYRFGVVTDDGYKLSSGATPSSKTPTLGLRSNGTANETIDFVVPVTGFYPFRFMWYERGGNAYAELFSVNLSTGERTLINDPNAAGSIKAFQDATQATVQLETSATVDSGYAVDAAASINTGTKTITVNASGASRFYRLKGLAARIKSVTVIGGQVTLVYE